MDSEPTKPPTSAKVDGLGLHCQAASAVREYGSQVHEGQARSAEPQPVRWSAGDHDVVVSEQRPIALYWNKFGDIVLLQRSIIDDEEDPFIVVRLENLQQLIDALQEFFP